MAWLEVEIDLHVTARQFAAELNDSALTQFILDLDAYRADLGFTVNLRDALTRAIEREASGA